MLSDIHQKLMVAKTRLRESEKLESMYEIVAKDLRSERQRGKSLEEKLKSEKADVDKLEGMSLTALFGTLIGSKDEWLKTEKEEYLRAKLSYETHLRVLENLEFKFKQISESLTAYDAVEFEYEKLLEEKRQALLKSSPKKALEMMGLADKMADLKADAKEINEAISAGEAALKSLEKVRSSLQSAENWGTVDLLGGGMMTTMVKHSNIDAAKREVQKSQVKLKSFEEELADAGERLKFSIEIDGFSQFGDLFFDGLIFDWTVQSGINKAMNNCKSVISKVNNSLSTCRKQAKEIEAKIEVLKKEKWQFVEDA